VRGRWRSFSRCSSRGRGIARPKDEDSCETAKRSASPCGLTKRVLQAFPGWPGGGVSCGSHPPAGPWRPDRILRWPVCRVHSAKVSHQIEFDHGIAREKGVLRLKGLRGHLARTQPLGIARTFASMLTIKLLEGDGCLGHFLYRMEPFKRPCVKDRAGRRSTIPPSVSGCVVETSLNLGGLEIWEILDHFGLWHAGGGGSVVEEEEVEPQRREGCKGARRGEEEGLLNDDFGFWIVDGVRKRLNHKGSKGARRGT
jgi:hypothetical protein